MPNTSWRLDGKVAVVTGGGAGIGRASALALAALGAGVLVVDRDEIGAATVAREIGAASGRASALAADVSSSSGATAIATVARERFGGIDILHNNAGIQRYGTVETTEESVWDEVMGVNVRSVFLVSRACLPLMRDRPGASIINTASTQAVVALPNSAAYVTSKHAVLGLSRAMAVDLAPDIRVNCICPGSVDTSMLRTPLALANDRAATWQAWAGMHLLNRVASADEIGAVVAFLAGPGASFITGAAIPIDGGQLMNLGGAPTT